MEISTMNDMLLQLYQEMIQYYEGDPRRIQHFVKVHSFASLLGRQEKLSAQTQFILEAAALVHDIGIRPAEARYGSCSGALQEKEGPAAAEPMLRRLGFPEDVISRVCYLVGHHHTYTAIDGPDYQLLVEADFLVNLYEDALAPDAVRAAYERIFRTPSGKRLCAAMFALSDETHF